MPGVIQMNCERYYTNLIEDDVEENILNAWNIQPVLPEHNTDYGIEGPLTIKPLFEFEYEAIVAGGYWIICENEDQPMPKRLPVDFIEYDRHSKKIHVKWHGTSSGGFTLGYVMPNGKMYQRYIVVESLM